MESRSTCWPFFFWPISVGSWAEVSLAALFIWQMDVETDAIATTATKNMTPRAPRHIAHRKVSWREVSKIDWPMSAHVGPRNDDHAAHFLRCLDDGRCMMYVWCINMILVGIPARTMVLGRATLQLQNPDPTGIPKITIPIHPNSICIRVADWH